MSTKTSLSETTELTVESVFPETSGLTVAHLRDFVEGANTAGLTGETRVNLSQTPQSDIRVIDIYIEASQSETETKDLETVPQAEEPV